MNVLVNLKVSFLSDQSVYFDYAKINYYHFLITLLLFIVKLRTYFRKKFCSLIKVGGFFRGGGLEKNYHYKIITGKEDKESYCTEVQWHKIWECK